MTDKHTQAKINETRYEQCRNGVENYNLILHYLCMETGDRQSVNSLETIRIVSYTAAKYHNRRKIGPEFVPTLRFFDDFDTYWQTLCNNYAKIM